MPRGQRKDEFRTKDKRKLPIFIESDLDDYGLSCVEFRTYGRIARRAGNNSTATESAPNMAEAFGVDVSTVRRALKVLHLCGLISKHERSGWTPEYALEDKEHWRDKAELKAVRETVLHPKTPAVTLVTTHRGNAEAGSSHETPGTLLTKHDTPYSPDTNEGTPVKVLPEGTPDKLARANGKQPKPTREERFAIPPDSCLELFAADAGWLKANAPHLPSVDVATQKWHRKQIAEGFKSKTLVQWRASWENYMITYSENEARRNGNGHERSVLSAEARAHKEADLRERMTGQRAS